MKLNVGSYLTNGLDYDTNSFVYDKYISLSAVQLLGPIEVNTIRRKQDWNFMEVLDFGLITRVFF